MQEHDVAESRPPYPEQLIDRPFDGAALTADGAEVEFDTTTSRRTALGRSGLFLILLPVFWWLRGASDADAFERAVGWLGAVVAALFLVATASTYLALLRAQGPAIRIHRGGITLRRIAAGAVVEIPWAELIDVTGFALNDNPASLVIEVEEPQRFYRWRSSALRAVHTLLTWNPQRWRRRVPDGVVVPRDLVEVDVRELAALILQHHNAPRRQVQHPVPDPGTDPLAARLDETFQLAESAGEFNRPAPWRAALRPIIGNREGALHRRVRQSLLTALRKRYLGWSVPAMVVGCLVSWPLWEGATPRQGLGVSTAATGIAGATVLAAMLIGRRPTPSTHVRKAVHRYRRNLAWRLAAAQILVLPVLVLVARRDPRALLTLALYGFALYVAAPRVADAERYARRAGTDPGDFIDAINRPEHEWRW